MSEPPPLERTVRVRCPAAHAFEVFTARIDLWWPPSHRRYERSQLHLEATEGGRFFERADSGDEATLGEVLACEPPHRIQYSWYPGADTRPTLVSIEFTEVGQETIVRVVHTHADSGLGDAWPSRVALFERAWTHVLAAFKAAAEG